MSEERLQAIADYVGYKSSCWEGVGARDVEEVLRQSALVGLCTLNLGTSKEPDHSSAWSITLKLAAMADGLEAGNSSAEEAAARLARVAKGVVG